MHSKSILPMAFLLAALCSGAQAQDAPKKSYSADELVQFMIDQVDLGSARAICIGTKSECADAQPKPKGFDMLLTFDLDSSDLLPEARSKLEVVAVALRDDRLRSAKFKVEGHTDARGSEGYNLGLSEARARSVVDFLVSRDVKPDRIIALGLGETSPLVEDPMNPANRRVELSLSVE